MTKVARILLFTLTITFALSACTKTVYVRQNGRTYNDYEAMKNDKIIDATKRPKVRNYKRKPSNRAKTSGIPTPLFR